MHVELTLLDCNNYIQFSTCRSPLDFKLKLRSICRPVG